MKKISKKFIYHGLGFPFELHNVQMVLVNDEYHPQIDVRKVADLAIKSLVLQEKRLTGNQIRFIRSYFSKSLRQFSSVVNESHMAIKKWENFKDKATNMDLNIEIMLRLYIYDQVAVKLSNSKKEMEQFYKHYHSLIKLFSRSALS